MPNAAVRNRKLSLRKRLLFSAAISVAWLMAWYATEIAYRMWHSIPLTGGIIFEGDLRMSARELRSNPRVRKYLATFQRSQNPLLVYEPRPGFSHDKIAINKYGLRDNV